MEFFAATARHRTARLLLLLAWMLSPVAALSQSVANGGVLYREYCISCHGQPPGGGADRAANNPALIAGAINGRVPAMAFLRSFISASDMADIAAYIASLSAPPPPPPPAPALDYTDLWWVESEPGRGVSIVHHAATNKMFVVIYTYDLDRRPLWLMIPDGVMTTPTNYAGPVYRVTGPPQTGAVFDSSRVRVVFVGNATLSFNDRDHAILAYTVDGRQVSQSISRTPF